MNRTGMRMRFSLFYLKLSARTDIIIYNSEVMIGVESGSGHIRKNLSFGTETIDDAKLDPFFKMAA